MANEYLATYLNDHLAGSLAAVELLEHLEAAYAETTLASFFAEVRSDISVDRKELQRLMICLRVTESRPRKVSAWLVGKVTELKIRLDDGARGPLRLLESLEVLGLGIHGKLGLWRALDAAAHSSPEWRASTMSVWPNAPRSNAGALRWFGWKLPRQLS
jgi:hypothetical protein